MQINIPDLSWSPYALLVVLAVAIGFAVAVLFMRRFKVEKQTVLYTCLLTVICTMVSSLVAGFKLTEEGPTLGFSGLGAVVGMIIGIFICSFIFKEKTDCVMASFVASAPLMYALAKTGCLVAGCCHGKDYTGHFAIVYHGEKAGSYFPAQLIDMAAFLIVFAIASALITKMENKVKAIYIILGITIPVRYVLEYLKFYHEGHLIESGQIQVLVAGAIAVIIVTVWKKVLNVNYH